MENQQDTSVDESKFETTPNDKGQILVEAFVRITDPATQEVLVETRA